MPESSSPTTTTNTDIDIRSTDIERRARQLFEGHQQKLCEQADHLFAVLLLIEWIAGVITALLVSPHAWSGVHYHTHVHVLVAVFVGGALALFPNALVLTKPGRYLNRQVIAISQMLFSALFIHLSGGRIETHFSVFGSLALLAFYRDWRVLVSAAVTITLDHLIRGIFWPQSVFGISFASPLRALEHGAWVVIECVFLLKGISASVKDMHDMARHRAELENTNNTIEKLVEDKTAQLRASEQEARQLALAVQQSQDAIFSLDRNAIVLSWNRGAEKLYGRTAAEMIGNVFAPNLPEKEKEMQRSLFFRVMKGESIESHETLIDRPDGTLLDVAVTLSPIRDDAGKLIALSAVVRDIAEKKAVEKRMSEFYSVVSHELRTPLTSIKGALALIANGIVEQGTDEATELIDIAQKSSTRLIRLINDILDLRKIEAGKFELNKSDVKLSNLVKNSVLAMTGFAESRNVRLESDVQLQSELPIDEDRVTQVLSNLISNAVKYAPENSAVEVHATVENDNVRVSVIDRGAGIPAEHLHKLFAKFQQVDSSDTRAKEGTGLGLAISKAIVEQHGGKIGVLSEPNVRTEFWFTLPVAVRQATFPEAGIVKRLAPHVAPIVANKDVDASKGIVLIVEDEYELSCLLKINLERQNYVCMQAFTLEQARDCLQQVTPSAIVLDVELPDGNGLEFLRRLHESEKERNIPSMPVIVITGSDQKADSATKNGIVDWLQKPFSQSTLSDSVKKALSSSARRKKVVVVDENPDTRTALYRELELLEADFIDAEKWDRSTRQPPVDLVVVNEDSLNCSELICDVRQMNSKGYEIVPFLIYSSTGHDSKNKSVTSVHISRHTPKDSVESSFVNRVETVLFSLLSQCSQNCHEEVKEPTPASTSGSTPAPTSASTPAPTSEPTPASVLNPT